MSLLELKQTLESLPPDQWREITRWIAERDADTDVEIEPGLVESKLGDMTEAEATYRRATSRKAHEVYERIKPQITDPDPCKWLEMDLLSGDFEIDGDEDAVHDRLKARRPDGHFVLMRSDGSSAGHFGGSG